jgi:hypothetical protein
LKKKQNFSSQIKKNSIHLKRPTGNKRASKKKCPKTVGKTYINIYLDYSESDRGKTLWDFDGYNDDGDGDSYNDDGDGDVRLL